MKVKIFRNSLGSELVGLEIAVNEWLTNSEVVVKDTNVGYAAITGGYTYAIITIWYEDVIMACVDFGQAKERSERTHPWEMPMPVKNK